MRILVACPTFAQKGYALEEWVRAYRAFNNADRAAFMVDNTPGTLDYLHQVRTLGIPAVHLEPLENPYHTLELCWRAITAQALTLACEYVASIEADVICPPETLDVLLDLGAGRDVIGHSYPTRGAWQGERMTGLGCTLIKVDWLAAGIDLWRDSPEQDIWRGSDRLELDGVLDIAHLDAENT